MGAVSRAGGTARHSPAAGSRSRRTQEPSELTNKAPAGPWLAAQPLFSLPSLSLPASLLGTRTKGPASLPPRTQPLSRSSPKSVNFSKRILQRELHYIHLTIKSVFQWSFDSSTCSLNLLLCVFLGAIISTQSISLVLKYPCR